MYKNRKTQARASNKVTHSRPGTIGMETVYVAGHKSPDLDSVVGTIAYAYLKNQLDTGTAYVPVLAEKANVETKYILEKYKIEEPQILPSIANKKVILVDHNEKYQIIDGLEDAEVLEVIDHHKMDFAYNSPIKIIIEPIGSSCSVIAKMFKDENLDIPKNLAATMLGAVLKDTVITKSPTSTKDDDKIIELLSKISGISDWKKYGMEIFKVASTVSTLSDEELVVHDYKDFDINGKKFGIGQIETVDPSEFSDRKKGLFSALDRKKAEGGYHTVLLFISDVINETSEFLVSSDDPEFVSGAFGKTIEGKTFVADVLSRKKQVVPALMEA